MPDNIASHLNVNTSGYTPVASPPATQLQEQPLIPTRSPLLRFSAPNIPGSFPSFDTLTGYHMGGKIPQWRIPTVPTQTGTSSSSTSTAATVFSSSSTTTNNPPLAQTASITTSVLSPAAQFTGIITMAKSFIVLSVSVNSAARVRLYSTASAQTLDLSRPITQGPGFGTEQGIIGDMVLSSAPTIWYPTPEMVGANGNSPQSTSIFLTVDNLSSSSAATSISIVYVPLQS